MAECSQFTFVVLNCQAHYHEAFLNEGAIPAMYICTYMSVTVRNVNLRSCSECRFALAPEQESDMCITHDVGTTFLGDRGQGGQRGWPFASYIFAEPNA